MTLKQVAEKYGLTQDGVDYALNQYGIVISEITHGLLSKLTYDAYDVIQCAQERWCETCELAKAQEPRVLTLDEVKALEENTPLYMEQRDWLYGWNVYGGVESGTDDIMTGAPWAVLEHWVQAEYGDSWRCWTSRPTDEQREATPWH